MSVSLLVTSGDGPAESAQAVGHIVDRMEVEADGLSLTIHRNAGRYGPKSAVVLVDGDGAEAFARKWVGTIQWRMKSQIRAHHKRANWFVGVFLLSRGAAQAVEIDGGDVTFSTLRAGGPGGQHQNTTDSAVRAVHRPTGLSVVVREDRSQHRNKALALERLRQLAEAHAVAKEELRKSRENKLHRRLERGNPVRVFKGAGFKEIR